LVAIGLYPSFQTPSGFACSHWYLSIAICI
jgi:hypothetical protein